MRNAFQLGLISTQPVHLVLFCLQINDKKFGASISHHISHNGILRSQTTF